MKAIDIAMRNHVTEDDLKKVCQELRIDYASGDSEVSDQDAFLIEKMIQGLKRKKADEAKQGGKIKLKRKVHVSKDIHSGEQAQSKTKEKDKDKTADEVTEKKPKAKASPKTSLKEKTTKEEKDQKPSTSPTAKKPITRTAKVIFEPDKPRPPRQYGQGKQHSSDPNRPRSAQRPYDPNKPRPAQRPFDPNKPRPAQRPFDPNKPRSAQRPFDPNKPSANRSSNRTSVRALVNRRTGGLLDDTKEKTSLSELTDLTQNRKKSLSKDKDKKKYKKEKFEEKTIDVRRKSMGYQKKESTTPSIITITENILVGELAKKLNLKASEVIAKLMRMGEMVTINQVIDADTVTILAAEYDTEVKVVSLYDETIIKQDQPDNVEDYIPRSPVVTVMGHVDHGKTRLLDTIRSTKVAEKEHGGITQHIGAYVVEVGDKKITFLDTPGHAAFTTMRARGANITDIVILVVAANDGVMPQTVEAIAHAKAADVPIVVAINKIDLEDANPHKVRLELSAHGLSPEEWGGTTLFAEISAKGNLNIDKLLELVLIQAEMLELKGNPKTIANGVVIESRLDAGQGAVASILVQKGTLRVGDPFVVGIYSGRIRAMYNDRGEEMKEAGLSTPVEILGLAGVPAAGDPFECVDSVKLAKQISQKRLEYKRIESAKKVRKVTLESLSDMIKDGEVKELNIIVKADVDGSAQALTESLEKLSTSEVRVKVIHSGTGGINESDVMLASASNAIIIGYHVRPTGKVSDIADKENVTIKFYNIIFEVTDDVKAAMEGMLSPEIKEIAGGTGEIRQVFKVSKLGTVAGAVLLSSKVNRKSRFRIIRDGIVVFDGALKSLKRYKDDVSEVVAGQEFGFALENFNDIKEGDQFEAYELIEVARTL